MAPSLLKASVQFESYLAFETIQSKDFLFGTCHVFFSVANNSNEGVLVPRLTYTAIDLIELTQKRQTMAEYEAEVSSPQLINETVQ